MEPIVFIEFLERRVMDTTPSKNTITGSRALVDALKREGIDHVFGIPGTQNLAFLDALRSTPEIRFILTRQDRKNTRLNSSHIPLSRMPSSA